MLVHYNTGSQSVMMAPCSFIWALATVLVALSSATISALLAQSRHHLLVIVVFESLCDTI